MSEEGTTATPMTHWLVSGAALIWNMFGVAVFAMTVNATPAQLEAQYNAAEIEFLQSIPVWATAANAIAVTAGVIASVYLLLKRSLAFPLFALSLAALLVQDLYSFVLADVVAVFGMVPVYIQGTVLVVAIALLLYSYLGKRRGLLR